jgi:copper chaperone NosL
MKHSCSFFYSGKMKLTKAGRISIIVVILFLGTLWFFPMWNIALRAPQYPGGLSLQIWINDIKGDTDIINGLNHYIGMKTIHKSDFKEFIYLPATMIAFMVLGLLIMILNKKKLYYAWTVLFVIIGLLSFYDFYQWEYAYGHDLDPNAPIKVPGQGYQPPLFGYKKLLNFEVLSQPHIAGWFYILAGVLLVSITVYEFKKSKKHVLQ